VRSLLKFEITTILRQHDAQMLTFHDGIAEVCGATVFGARRYYAVDG